MEQLPENRQTISTSALVLDYCQKHVGEKVTGPGLAATLDRPGNQTSAMLHRLLLEGALSGPESLRGANAKTYYSYIVLPKVAESTARDVRPTTYSRGARNDLNGQHVKMLKPQPTPGELVNGILESLNSLSQMAQAGLLNYSDSELIAELHRRRTAEKT